MIKPMTTVLRLSPLLVLLLAAACSGRNGTPINGQPTSQTDQISQPVAPPLPTQSHDAQQPSVDDPQKPTAGRVVSDKSYDLLFLRNDEKRGTYTLKVIERKFDKQIEIFESVTIESDRKRVGYQSSVVYSAASTPVPLRGEVSTTIDGQPAMTGGVTFADGKIRFECVKHYRKSKDKPVKPPKVYDKRDSPIPEGVLLFQSALATIGLRLLPRDGVLENIVFVEFPDDIKAPELINFKTGYLLIREIPDKNGAYALRLLDVRSKELVYHIQFDQEDRMVSAEMFGKFKLVERDDAAAENVVK